MISTFLALVALALPPKPAARLFNRRLVPICHRESRCKRLGVHKIDGHLGESAWRKAVARGLLDPKNCPHHKRRADMREWSTSGPFGLIRAYSMQYLPESCMPPEVLDIPLVAAYVANKRYQVAKSGRGTAALKRWAKLAPPLRGIRDSN